MQDQRGRTSFIRRGSISFLAGALTVIAAALTPSFTENAAANGETRTIYLYHTHTHEQIAATYLVNGQYDQAVLKQLNWFLRDWRRDEPTTMDPRLFDIVWEAYRQAGADEPINVVSAYRSPETNAMLRRRSRAVARYSQHMLGKAMDTTMPGMSMSRIREIGMRMQRGGVGYYPSAGTPFVHLDVGSVRSWPRMSYEQLVRLFPDGKTVHLPTNNQPLARYDEARAEIEARGGAYAPVERKSKSFLAFLFGGGEEDEDSGVVAPPSNARRQWASLAPRGSRSAAITADAEEEGASAPPAEKPGRHKASSMRLEKIAEAERNLPRGETALAPATETTETRNAPLPPERPSRGERQTPLALAALEPVADEESPAAKIAVAPPLPPRRPTNLLAFDAPLPPARPVELALLTRGAEDITHSVALPAPGAAPEAKEGRAGAAIASLIDVTGATPLASPGEAGLRGSATIEATKPKPEPLLAYAPPAAQQNDARETPAAAQAGARLPTATKPTVAKPAIQRADVLPARLDRSNFRALTAAAPTSRMAAGSVLGSTIAAPRSAARAEPNLFAAKLEGNYASAFAPTPAILPTDRFVTRR